MEHKWKTWMTRIGIQRRKAYLDKKKSQLQNTTPTIISNNCISGMVYHDLDLEFRSPTINLQIFEQDFFRFVCRLEEYLQCDVTQVFDERFSYPIGELRLQDEAIRVYFVHYKSFQEAKEKWIERCRRVDLDNLFIVFLHRAWTHPHSKSYLTFRGLPHRNKVMLTFPVGIFDKAVVPFFSPRLKNQPGRILEYPHLYSKKRYIDRFDFVRFFNQGKKTK